MHPRTTLEHNVYTGCPRRAYINIQRETALGCKTLSAITNYSDNFLAPPRPGLFAPHKGPGIRRPVRCGLPDPRINLRRPSINAHSWRSERRASWERNRPPVATCCQRGPNSIIKWPSRGDALALRLLAK